MYKILEYDSHFEPTGEPRIVPIDNFNSGLIKQASDISSFIDTLQTDSDFWYLWIIAMTAMEAWGSNKNGDAFLERHLQTDHKYFTEIANVFRHHKNKDPEKALGKPVYSTYNPDMRRVELILKVRKGLASDLDTRIDSGEYLPFSMGCHVPYDECSYCSSVHKTRRDYC